MQKPTTVALSLLVSLIFAGCGTPSQQKAAPVAESIVVAPNTAVVGSPDLTISIRGRDFAGTGSCYTCSNSVAVWSSNGTETALATTFVNSALLTAVVPAALLSSPANVQLFVRTSAGTDGTRQTQPAYFSVMTAPVPRPEITAISPSTVAAGSPDVTITIDGSNFGHYGHFIWSTAFWTTNGNLHDTGTWLQTTILSDSQLTAVIPAKLLQRPTSVDIVVMNGDVMGMSDGFFGYPKSNAVSFEVTP